jgi:predicted secreted Zn-dependent protease
MEAYQDFVVDRRATAETGGAKPRECVRQINQSTTGRKIEQPNCANRCKAKRQRRRDSGAVAHQNQIGIQRPGQKYRLAFTIVQKRKLD